jgi:DNA-binding transcriptional ArsR family regulator
MVHYSSEALDAVFSALADPTRRAILTRLGQGDASVTELAEPFDVTLPAVSKHLRVLEGAGLLARAKEGRVHRCRLVAGPMQDAAAWLARYRRFWEASFDALESYLARTARPVEQGDSVAAQSHRRQKKAIQDGNRPRKKRVIARHGMHYGRPRRRSR